MTTNTNPPIVSNASTHKSACINEEAQRQALDTLFKVFEAAAYADNLEQLKEADAAIKSVIDLVLLAIVARVKTEEPAVRLPHGGPAEFQLLWERGAQEEYVAREEISGRERKVRQS